MRHRTAQVRAAIFLRDRAVQDQTGALGPGDRLGEGTPGAHRSPRRSARRSHIYEALGRAVERAIRRPTAITALRGEFPLRQSYQASGQTAGASATATPSSGASRADPTRAGPALAAVGLAAAEIDALRPLREVIETYGDLLLADAAYH